MFFIIYFSAQGGGGPELIDAVGINYIFEGFPKNMLHFSNAYSSKLLELFEKVLNVESEYIDGEEIPFRWGVEEVIASDYYKNIKKNIKKLRRKFYIFLRLVYNYDNGLANLLGMSKNSKSNIMKIYSSVQNSLYNNSFNEIKSPIIDHGLRSAIWNEEYLHVNKNFRINNYFSSKKSHPELQDFDFSKRAELSIVNENNFVDDKLDQLEQILKFYSIYRKKLFPSFYADDVLTVDKFQLECIQLLSEFSYNYMKILKSNQNYRFIGIGSEQELDFALRNYHKWQDECEKQGRIIKSVNFVPPFDCLLTFNSNESTSQNLNTAKFNQLFNSAIASNKFITCLFKGDKIGNFEQAGFIEGEKKGRIIDSEDNVKELFGDAEFSFSYLRNFIINVDENFYNSLGNDYEKLHKVIDEFIEDCNSQRKDIFYKPRLFIYTTAEIYSSLPQYFHQKYKLIEAPDTNNEDDIIERVRTAVLEKYEERFELVDWKTLLGQVNDDDFNLNNFQLEAPEIKVVNNSDDHGSDEESTSSQSSSDEDHSLIKEDDIVSASNNSPHKSAAIQKPSVKKEEPVKNSTANKDQRVPYDKDLKKESSGQEEIQLENVTEETIFIDLNVRKKRTLTITVNYEGHNYVFDQNDLHNSGVALKKGGYGEVFEKIKRCSDPGYNLATNFIIKTSEEKMKNMEQTGCNNGFEIKIAKDLSDYKSDLSPYLRHVALRIMLGSSEQTKFVTVMKCHGCTKAGIEWGSKWGEMKRFWAVGPKSMKRY